MTASHGTPHLDPSQRAELARAKRAARRVGLIFPMALLTAVLVLLIIWLPRMPDPAATHWSGSGGPDGFGPRSSYIWLTLLAGHGLALMIWGFIAWSGRMPAASPKRVPPVWSGYQRFLAAFNAGFAALMAISLLTSAGAQLDVADAADAGSVWPAIALGFGAWVLVSVAAWFLQPSIEILRQAGAPSRPLELSRTERAVWFGEVRPSRTFLWVTGAAILTLVVCSAFVFTTTDDGVARTVMIGSTLLVVILSSMSLWFRVRIDSAGLEARSIVGWPVFRLPAADVQSVQAAQISPLPEFGGWGMRWAPGRFGLVMRTGDGIIVTRTDGRIFALTTDDAERGSAALAAAAARATKQGDSA